MTTRTNPITHARMYAVAEFYGVSGLRNLAEKKCSEAAQVYWDSDAFAEAIEIVYTTTVAEDCELRKVVKNVLTDHAELIDKPKIEACMREVPDLAFDTLKAMRGIQDAKWRSRGTFESHLAQQGGYYGRYPP